MYQRAIKVARVLEENKKETQALNLEKRKREFPKQGFLDRSDKRFRPDFPLGKGKQPMTRPPHYPNCRTCGKSHPGRCFYENLHCYECGQRGHKRSECLKLIGSQNRVIPSTKLPRPPLAPLRPSFAAPRGRPPVSDTQQQAMNSRKLQTGGRIYCLEAEEGGDEDPHAVVSGTFIVNVIPTKVLFDIGATHSFINSCCCSTNDLCF